MDPDEFDRVIPAEVKKEQVRPVGQATILDVRGAACLLGLTEKGLRHLIERRRIPHRRIGRRVVILRDELDRWLHDLPGISLEEVHAMQERGGR